VRRIGSAARVRAGRETDASVSTVRFDQGRAFGGGLVRFWADFHAFDTWTSGRGGHAGCRTARRHRRDRRQVVGLQAPLETAGDRIPAG
jgi:hypothetical protein